MQLPPGPQRVRGLAGTGKTVILSMKAALTHVSQPGFKILFLFNTRSMYKQIREKISTYYIREAQKEPNWNNVDVLHAWGGKEQEGLYSKICKLYNLTPKTFRDVGNFSDPLEVIYSDLLTTLKQLSKVEPIYDIVLIDEAQDFSPALFEAVYLFTKDPKRIIWAYDEFQSLSELKIREPEELFGKGADGTPNIANTSLQGQYGGRIDKDFVLPNSYRNPRLTLMAAHGLALGIYRREGIIDVLEHRQDWRALGYEVTTPPEKGTYAPGEHLVIERPESYSRNVLERLLKENGEDEQTLVTIEAFGSRKAELEYVVREIEDLVNFQGADPSQIIVIALDQSNAGTQFNLLRSLLMQRNIPSITPGFVESAGEFQWEGHVTLTTPFRAKGNESHFVFVLNIEKVPSDYTFRSRNALFVSITRALGWSYITGVGEKVAELEEEVRKISGDYPEFKFVFPSIEELSRRRALLSKNDKRVLSQQENLEEILSENPDLLIERLSGDPALLKRLSSDPVLVAKLREALRHKPKL